MLPSTELTDFLTLSKNELIVDVRTPAEFEQGHIIGAINIPLFTNEERVLVGTCYKQQGRQSAILLGFELIGSRWSHYIKAVEAIAKSKKIFVHCWRGGMRSASMAWALQLYGFNVLVLKGGYKTYRQFVLLQFEKQYSIIILSGKTGSGKTLILHELEKQGEQIIDLEGLAQHQGSSFGSLGIEHQPSQEMFENRLAHALLKLDPNKKIWFENESIVIGKRVIPAFIFKQMREARVIDIDVEKQERINFLNTTYGVLPKYFLKDSVLKIAKRLGPEQTKYTLLDIDEDRMKSFIEKVLVYYDKYYSKGNDKRNQETIFHLSMTEINPFTMAKEILIFCLKNKL
jgi:tRNA 2-selenouridine synthase